MVVRWDPSCPSDCEDQTASPRCNHEQSVRKGLVVAITTADWLRAYYETRSQKRSGTCGSLVRFGRCSHHLEPQAICQNRSVTTRNCRLLVHLRQLARAETVDCHDVILSHHILANKPSTFALAAPVSEPRQRHVLQPHATCQINRGNSRRSILRDRCPNP